MESTSDVKPTFIERRVYKGARVHRGYKVSSVACVPEGSNSFPSELVPATGMEEYSSGCPLHRGGCFGHMSITPTGNLLPPHSLSFRSGDIRTQYHIATSKAFTNDSAEYRELLKRTNYRKHGHLRSIMGTPVSGSARLVAICSDDSDPRKVFISRSLAEKIVFCAPEVDSSGREASVYMERCLQQGDYVMVERPPSLTRFNNQPLTAPLTQSYLISTRLNKGLTVASATSVWIGEWRNALPLACGNGNHKRPKARGAKIQIPYLTLVTVRNQ